MIFSWLFKKHNKKIDNSIKKAASEDETRIINDTKAIGTDISGIPGEELVAVITAALQACYSIEPQNKLVIKSIKRTGISTPIWSKTGRMERLSKKL